MRACDELQVTALADGELDEVTARAVRAHLGDCDRCLDTLAEALLIDGLAETHDVAQRTLTVPVQAVPRAPARKWGRWPLILGSGLALAAGVALVCLRMDPAPGAAAVFAELAAQPRHHEFRIAYHAADRHRSYDGPRAASGPAALALLDLTAVERTGDLHALAAAQLLAGLAGQAEAHLRRLPESPDVLNDRAAAALARGAAGEALALLNRARAQAPRHPQALWNKALILERQGDAVAAAGLFDSVAGLQEPGWSAEARARAAGR